MTPEGSVLTRRQLNRTLLERHLLLRRTKRSTIDVVEHLVGMQAQEPRDPYVGLWTRIDGFSAAELEDAIVKRRAARTRLMRATIHLVSARDCIALWPLLRRVLERNFLTGSPFGRRLSGTSLDELAAAGRRLIEEEPRTTAELRSLLGDLWPDRDGEAMAYAITHLIPVVQVPPRGLWRTSGEAKWTSVERWLGKPIDAQSHREAMVLRYLRAFGPASVMDMQAWCGLTRLRGLVEVLRPQLRSFRDEQGRELWDVVDAPLQSAEVPAPVRFLPQFDNVLLGHADRTRIAPPEAKNLVWRRDGWWSGVLIDGFLRGTWGLDRKHKRASRVLVSLADDVTTSEHAEVDAEAERLQAFLLAGAKPNERTPRR